MIIDDYMNYVEKYKSKYGDKTIVLMQVGSFFELYAITEDDKDIYKIADICNIQISRRNKTILDVSRDNYLMCGFPLYVINKFTNILLQHNYTIILIEQTTEPPNPKREVTEILSPGMNLTPTNKKSNYMMVLYWEKIDNNLIVGISGIDLSTGNCFVYDAASTKTDPEFSLDETYRIISTYNPCEIVFLSNDKITDDIKQYILKNLNLSNILVHKKWNNYEYIEVMKKISYQSETLEKAYAHKKSLLSIIDVLNLEKLLLGRISFCCLIQFAYEHNSDLIKELNEPEILENNKLLTIEYNSAIQLNIISLNNHDKPLIDILNRCSTSFGSRAFKERLINPVIDEEILNKRYDDIEYLLENNKYKKIGKILNNILDLERIKRRMIVGKFPPMDWCSFNISLEYALEVLNILENTEYIEYINELKNSFNNILNLDLASKYNLSDIKGSVFYDGIYEEIDKYENDYRESYNKIEDIKNKISTLDSTDNTSCKIDYNDRDGYYISITNKRFDTANSINSTYMSKFDKKKLSASSNILKLTNKNINIYSKSIENSQSILAVLVLKAYQDFVKKFIVDNCDILDKLIKYLTNIDISCCCARNAQEYRYYRPKIELKNTSYMSCINIRHPIIERIEERVKYVGNDIKMGYGDENDSFNGMLLYGINASGKSSFMKTVGLNIIMAQAGMYVAANDFIYQPYHHIFTRISGMDNIYKGMSSFTVEMTELRNILQRADKYSLVLGDELCCGTESTSALAIVAAGIDALIKRKSSFIFATHLHELVDLSIIRSYLEDKQVINKKLYIGHMHITFDDKNTIIYERKIKDGKGSSVYGIEVCGSLDMPNDFMKIAEGVRKEIQELDVNIIPLNKSRYNKKIYMTKCKICGGKAEETHHINYQHKSDKDGYFVDHHKNDLHNLVPLCKECHKKETYNEINIKEFKQTTKGIVLNIEDIEDIEDKKEKEDKEEESEIFLKNDKEINYENIKMFVRRGKLNWYIRKTKTSPFRKCSNENRVLEIIKKLGNINDNCMTLNDTIYSVLFDPGM